MTSRGEQPTLTGERVRLRPWRADDAPTVSAACQDAAIQQWTQVPVPYRRADADGFVTAVASASWAQGGALFAVEACDGGARLCDIGLCPPADGVGEAGYWTVAGRRGRGYSAEALGVLTDWAFDELGLRRMELHVDPANTGFRRVAERAGFFPEGLVRQRWPYRREPADYLLYARPAAKPRPAALPR